MSIGQMQSIFARLDAIERDNDQLRKRLESLEEAVTVPADLADAAYVRRGPGRPKGALNGR